MTLADRIAVFMDGRIVQVGTPREIFATAAARWRSPASSARRR